MINCVLLVDDDDADNLFHKRVLKKSGEFQDIHVFDDPKSALVFLREAKVDEAEIIPKLIFLDINMPGMDGWRFVKEFEDLPKKYRDGVKLFMLSNGQDPRERQRAKDHEIICGFIEKPLSPEKLKNVLNCETPKKTE